MGDGNCGGTSFHNSLDKSTDNYPLLQIPFKENRLVIFPSHIPHTGYVNQGYPNNSKRVIYSLLVMLEHSSSIYYNLTNRFKLFDI